MLPHFHVNVAVYFAQSLKHFAQIMANISVLGMRPNSLHPHVVRLWTETKDYKKIPEKWHVNKASQSNCERCFEIYDV